MTYKLTKERVYLFLPAADLFLYARLRGRLEKEELTAAICKAVEANSILRCHIVLSPDGEAVLEEEDEGEVFPYAPEYTEGDWRKTVEEQQRIRFITEEGELVRFFAYPGEDETGLLICLHHLAGDGLSAVSLLEDITDALDGKELPLRPVRLFDPSSVPPRVKLPLMTRMLVSGMNRKWRETGRMFPMGEADRLFRDYVSLRPRAVALRSIEGDAYGDLLAKARRNGVTVTALLSAALLKATGRSELGVTVSLREEGDRSISNQATGVTLSGGYQRDKGLGDNAALIQTRLRLQLNDPKKKYFLVRFLTAVEPTLIDGAAFSAFGGLADESASLLARAMGYTGGEAGVGLSNLGLLEEEGRGRLLSVDFAPPLPPNMKYMAGAVSCSGRLCLTLHTVADDLKDAEKLLDEVVACLLPQKSSDLIMEAEE